MQHTYRKLHTHCKNTVFQLILPFHFYTSFNLHFLHVFVNFFFLYKIRAHTPHTSFTSAFQPTQIATEFVATTLISVAPFISTIASRVTPSYYKGYIFFCCSLLHIF